MLPASRNRAFAFLFSALCVSLFVVSCTPDARQDPSQPGAIEIDAVQVRSTSRLQDFKADGALSAGREAVLKAQTRGTIGATFIATPQDVSTDQAVLTLVADGLELELRAKQSEFKATQAELESVQAEHDALPDREEGGDRDEALAARERALTLKLDQIDDEIELAEYRLKQSNLLAPFDGVLTPIKPLYAGESVEDGEPLYRLVAFDPLSLKFLLPVLYEKDVTTGTEIVVIPYSDPTQNATGTISAIAPYAQNPDLLDVTAQIENSHRLLKVGERGEVRVLGKSDRTSLLLPRRVISRGKGGNETPRVFLVRGDHILTTPVRLGKERGDEVEISGDLRVGDWVAVPSAEPLTDNQTVKINRLR